MPVPDLKSLGVTSTGSLELPLARDRDLRLILEDFGLLEQFEAGELLCEHSATEINWDNLGAVVTSAGKLKLYCDLPDCIEQASAKTE